MGVLVEFQTSGIVGITELSPQSISMDATLTSNQPEDSTSFAQAIALVGDGTRRTFTVTLPEPTISGQPAIKEGSVIKFKYLISQITDGTDDLYYPNEAAADARDLSGLVTTMNEFPAYPVVTIAHNMTAVDGQMENIIVNVPNQSFELIFHGGTLGWVVY